MRLLKHCFSPESKWYATIVLQLFSILRSFFCALPWCARWRCGTSNCSAHLPMFFELWWIVRAVVWNVRHYQEADPLHQWFSNARPHQLFIDPWPFRDPFRHRDYLSTFRWCDWPLGVGIDHFENLHPTPSITSTLRLHNNFSRWLLLMLLACSSK